MKRQILICEVCRVFRVSNRAGYDINKFHKDFIVNADDDDDILKVRLAPAPMICAMMLFGFEVSLQIELRVIKFP